MCGAFSALLRARQLYWGWPHFSGLPVWEVTLHADGGELGLVKSSQLLAGPQTDIPVVRRRSSEVDTSKPANEIVSQNKDIYRVEPVPASVLWCDPSAVY